MLFFSSGNSGKKAGNCDDGFYGVPMIGIVFSFDRVFGKFGDFLHDDDECMIHAQDQVSNTVITLVVKYICISSMYSFRL